MENISNTINEKKEKLWDFLISPDYKNYMTRDELRIYVQVKPEEDMLFDCVIDELTDEGRLFLSKKKKLVPYKKLGYHMGELRTHENGFGFVRCDDMDEDVHIRKADLHGAVHKDRVIISITSESPKGISGVVKKIVSRGLESITGTYRTVGGIPCVIPDDARIFRKIKLSKKECRGMEEDSKVVVKITRPPGKSRIPMGKITEVLGLKSDVGADISSIVAGLGIPHEFFDKVKKQVRKIPLNIDGENLNDREDFRNVMTVTIDGEDAKDLDDAVSCRRMENGHYELGVYIADVSHYVKADTPIDKEAYKRGTSVYLPDRVIPMLPEILSNGICSLNEGQDRLALCCIMEINAKGSIKKHRIVKGVINVNKRMTYDKVNDVLENDCSVHRDEYAEFMPMLGIMKELRDILFDKREARGSVSFEFQESGVTLDDRGKPLEIVIRQRNTATSIIEEFMLAANETVAESYFWLEIPFIYRSHEEPEREKYDMLKKTVGKMGYVLRGYRKNPKNLQKLLKDVRGKDEELMISRLALRSMQQARYTSECLGHYGLSAKYYCHFTSPIRRYPDLFIHRIISLCIEGHSVGELISQYGAEAVEKAKGCSIKERRAEDAEREALLLKKTEYMADKVGEAFNGIISSITSWGIFVQLENTVEGMVSYKDMTDDIYEYDEESMSCMGVHTHRTYVIGSRVRVILERADTNTKRLDFVFCGGKTDGNNL